MVQDSPQVPMSIPSTSPTPHSKPTLQSLSQRDLPLADTVADTVTICPLSTLLKLLLHPSPHFHPLLVRDLNHPTLLPQRLKSYSSSLCLNPLSRSPLMLSITLCQLPTQPFQEKEKTSFGLEKGVEGELTVRDTPQAYELIPRFFCLYGHIRVRTSDVSRTGAVLFVV